MSILPRITISAIETWLVCPFNLLVFQNHHTTIPTLKKNPNYHIYSCIGYCWNSFSVLDHSLLRWILKPTSILVGGRFNKHENLLMRFGLGRCKTGRFSHLPTESTGLYRGSNWVQSGIPTRWSQQNIAHSVYIPSIERSHKIRWPDLVLGLTGGHVLITPTTLHVLDVVL